MVRGTTQTYTFSVPFDTDLISNIKVNFSQDIKETFSEKFA